MLKPSPTDGDAGRHRPTGRPVLPKDQPVEDRKAAVAEIIDQIINSDWYVQQLAAGERPGKTIADAVVVAIPTAQARGDNSGSAPEA